MEKLFTSYANGWLVADRNIEAPVAPEGFESAWDDPWLFLQALPKCDKRTLRMIKDQPSCGKCKPMQVVFCGEQRVTRGKCLDCKGG